MHETWFSGGTTVPNDMDRIRDYNGYCYTKPGSLMVTVTHNRI